MSIDVLSDPGTAPIIVGDEPDMSDLQGVGTDDKGQYHLLMNGRQVALSAPASENFRMAEHLLLVNLAGEKVASARRVRMDDFNDSQVLSESQCNALAEALTLTSDPASREFYNDAIASFKNNYPDLAAA